MTRQAAACTAPMVPVPTIPTRISTNALGRNIRQLLPLSFGTDQSGRTSSRRLLSLKDHEPSRALQPAAIQLRLSLVPYVAPAASPLLPNRSLAMSTDRK